MGDIEGFWRGDNFETEVGGLEARGFLRHQKDR